MSLEEGKKFQVREATETMCPFCGKVVAAGTMENGTEEGMPFVSHQMPACQSFADMDPADFLSECNRILIN